jgi:hypothetical protein
MVLGQRRGGTRWGWSGATEEMNMPTITISDETYARLRESCQELHGGEEAIFRAHVDGAINVLLIRPALTAAVRADLESYERWGERLAEEIGVNLETFRGRGEGEEGEDGLLLEEALDLLFDDLIARFAPEPAAPRQSFRTHPPDHLGRRSGRPGRARRDPERAAERMDVASAPRAVADRGSTSRTTSHRSHSDTDDP